MNSCDATAIASKVRSSPLIATVSYANRFLTVPFLPVRDEFHPKRNQARQKLATLPVQRFKDLSGDVYYEIGRRYPEFKEPEVYFALPPSQLDADCSIHRSPNPQTPQRHNTTNHQTQSPQTTTHRHHPSPFVETQTPNQQLPSPNPKIYQHTVVVPPLLQNNILKMRKRHHLRLGTDLVEENRV
jgi:hypothetical protein